MTSSNMASTLKITHVVYSYFLSGKCVCHEAC